MLSDRRKLNVEGTASSMKSSRKFHFAPGLFDLLMNPDLRHYSSESRAVNLNISISAALTPCSKGVGGGAVSTYSEGSAFLMQ